MKNIVILGAGFGGLRTAMVLGRKAKRLAKLGYQVVLVDKNDYHTYTPTLYEISSTSKETANYVDLKSVVTFSIKDLLHSYGIQFRQATVAEIEVKRGQVLLAGGDVLPYSHLVIALGAETNYFGIAGMAEEAITLKSFTDAVAIRDAIWNRVTAANRNEVVEVVIGGAGSTGVELAAELQEWFAELKREGARCDIQTTIVDLSPRILGVLSEAVATKAMRRLRKLGARVLTDTRIEKVRQDKLTLHGDTRLRFDVLIWAGGIKPHSLVESLPLKFDAREGLVVSPAMAVKPTSQKLPGKIYAIGDNAFSKYPQTQRPVPKVARAAISGGTVAAQNILADITGSKRAVFRPANYPYIVPTGGKHAVAKIGPIILSGIWGWFLKGLVELNYLASIMPVSKAVRIWLHGLKLFVQNDRLG